MTIRNSPSGRFMPRSTHRSRVGRSSRYAATAKRNAAPKYLNNTTRDE